MRIRIHPNTPTHKTHTKQTHTQKHKKIHTYIQLQNPCKETQMHTHRQTHTYKYAQNTYIQTYTCTKTLIVTNFIF